MRTRFNNYKRNTNNNNFNTNNMENQKKFDNWMLKIKNIYYSDNERMCEAYQRIKEC